jgi:hypothetical protein
MRLIVGLLWDVESVRLDECQLQSTNSPMSRNWTCSEPWCRRARSWQPVLRIPGDADQRSELMSITIPK